MPLLSPLPVPPAPCTPPFPYCSEAGIDETVIQRTAGHSTNDMTRKYNKDRRTCSVDSEVWNGLIGLRKKGIKKRGLTGSAPRKPLTP